MAENTVDDAATGVAVLDSPETFNTLHRPDAAAAIWRRRLPADFQDWLDALPTENLPSARTVVRTAVVSEAVDAVCAAARMPISAGRGFLVEDTAMLARRFAGLMGSEYLRLRFDVVHDNACRKFHLDAVTARLVCTYRGMGTQYGIASGGTDPEHVFSTPTGSPILLKGTLWPEQPASALLHRSPPIEGTGKTRLVLVIDPVSDEPGKRGGVARPTQSNDRKGV